MHFYNNAETARVTAARWPPQLRSLRIGPAWRMVPLCGAAAELPAARGVNASCFVHRGA